MPSPTSPHGSDLDASFVLVDTHGPPSPTKPGLAEQRAPILSPPQPQPAVESTPSSAQPAEHASVDASYEPGSSATYAHDWSQSGTGGKVKIQGAHFVDAYGRACHLRGVNLGGNCKTPTNHDPATFPDDHHTVTFVNRPFPLDEAHEHFSRLRRWGLTFIRFLVTWEAVEHEGPGIYDTAYLAYLHALLSLLPEYGLVAFVSVHQDVWSRFAGGSGAPGWTMEAVGFDLRALEDTGAAWLAGVRGDVAAERGIWPCGYQKLAAATMATCFWAGDTFAPKLRCKTPDGKDKPVQAFLQDAFLDMWAVLGRTVADLPGVVGFQMMNEPHRGYVEQKSLNQFVYETDLHLSVVPSAFESFLLGAGHPTTVGYWTRSFPFPTRRTSERLLNPERKTVWRADGPTQGRCLWEMHGVWGWDRTKDLGVVLREGYFMRDPMGSREVDWYGDFYYPFASRWADRVRAAGGSEKMVFLEPIPNEFCPESWTADKRPAHMVFAPHWYDLNALFAKAFGDFTVNVQGLSRGMFPLKAFYWGQRGARDNYSLQIGNIAAAAHKALADVPVIIGECGVPMDLNNGAAFKTGDWKWQARMMDALLVALERSGVGFTLWNYNPENTDAEGDGWNGENFSWFSNVTARPPALQGSAQTDAALDAGARVLPSVVRPYAAKVAGIPRRCTYESTTGRAVFEWAELPADGAGAPRARETEIFVPAMLTRGRALVVSFPGAPAGAYAHKHDEGRQTLFVVPRGPVQSGKVHVLEIAVEPPLERALFVVNDIWGDYGSWIGALMALVLAVVGYWVVRL